MYFNNMKFSLMRSANIEKGLIPNYPKYYDTYRYDEHTGIKIFEPFRDVRMNLFINENNYSQVKKSTEYLKIIVDSFYYYYYNKYLTNIDDPQRIYKKMQIFLAGIMCQCYCQADIIGFDMDAYFYEYIKKSVLMYQLTVPKSYADDLWKLYYNDDFEKFTKPYGISSYNYVCYCIDIYSIQFLNFNPESSKQDILSHIINELKNNFSMFNSFINLHTIKYNIFTENKDIDIIANNLSLILKNIFSFACLMNINVDLAFDKIHKDYIEKYKIYK